VKKTDWNERREELRKEQPMAADRPMKTITLRKWGDNWWVTDGDNTTTMATRAGAIAWGTIHLQPGEAIILRVDPDIPDTPANT